MLIIGANAQQYNVHKDATVSDVLKSLEDLGDLPSHSKPLTLKADGVVLGSRAKLPQDVLTLELIEQHDPAVVGSTEGDAVAELPTLDTNRDNA